MSELHERSEERRRRIVAHRAKSFEDAERWDLEYWQACSPEERLEAFMAIRREVQLVARARTGERAPEE